MAYPGGGGRSCVGRGVLGGSGQVVYLGGCVWSGGCLVW